MKEDLQGNDLSSLWPEWVDAREHRLLRAKYANPQGPCYNKDGPTAQPRDSDLAAWGGAHACALITKMEISQDAVQMLESQPTLCVLRAALSRLQEDQCGFLSFGVALKEPGREKE
jgi:hypothetical protein